MGVQRMKQGGRDTAERSREQIRAAKTDRSRYRAPLVDSSPDPHTHWVRGQNWGSRKYLNAPGSKRSVRGAGCLMRTIRSAVSDSKIGYGTRA
jgi:hypothetical protein